MFYDEELKENNAVNLKIEQLVEASEAYKNSKLRAFELIEEIKQRGDLELTILSSIEAAGHELDIERQKQLMTAACFAKKFCSSCARTEYYAMIQNLRVINFLRSNKIPMTYEEYKCLTPDLLVNQLMNMDEFALALWVSRWLKVPNDEGESKVYSSWVSHLIRTSYLSDSEISDKIAEVLGSNPVISYADIAAKALDGNRTYLALKIIEHESYSSRQIPFLLELKDFEVVFPRALESFDSNLIYMTLFKLIDSTKNEARLLNQLKKYDTAIDYFIHYAVETDVPRLKLILHSARRYQDEFRVYLRNCYSSNARISKSHHIESLESALSVSKLCDKNEFVIHQMDLKIKLVKFQYGLSKVPPPKFNVTSWVDMSTSETIINLLKLKEINKARDCRKLMEVSEEKFQTLKLIAADALKPLPLPIAVV